MARAYKDFPDTYFQLIDRATEDGLFERLMTMGEAMSIRRDLYRFFDQLRKADDIGDTYASEMMAKVRNITCSVKKEPDGKGLLVLKLNPLVGIFEEDDEKIERRRESHQGSELADKLGKTTGDELDLSDIEDVINEIDQA